MSLDLSVAWTRLQTLAIDVVALLPNLAIGLVVFVLFVLLAGGIRAIVMRATTQQRRHRNLGLVLGRLTQALVVFVGLLVALADQRRLGSPSHL